MCLVNMFSEIKKKNTIHRYRLLSYETLIMSKKKDESVFLIHIHVCVLRSYCEFISLVRKIFRQIFIEKELIIFIKRSVCVS